MVSLRRSLKPTASLCQPSNPRLGAGFISVPGTRDKASWHNTEVRGQKQVNLKLYQDCTYKITPAEVRLLLFSFLEIFTAVRYMLHPSSLCRDSNPTRLNFGTGLGTITCRVDKYCYTPCKRSGTGILGANVA